MTELETYNHILAVASRLFAQNGFDKTSMNEIVRESNLSKGGIYWHFKSKQAIIFAVVETIFQQQMAFLENALATEGKAVARLQHLLAQIVASMDDSQAEIPYAIDVYALALRNDELNTLLKGYFQTYQTKLAELIAQGIAEGDFVASDPNNVAMIFISTIEGIIVVNNVMKQPDILPTLIQQATQLFLNGLYKETTT